MNCPNCASSLKARRKDLSIDSDKGVTYTRSVYHCKPCDIWLTVEVPKKNNVKKQKK